MVKQNYDVFSGFFANCEEVASLEALRDIMVGEAARWGLRYIALVVGAPTLSREQGAIRLNNYPAPWLSRMAERGYLATDPVLRHANHAQSGFSWDDADFLGRLNDRQRRMLAEARAFRIAHGFTTPVFAFGAQSASLSGVSETGDIHPETRCAMGVLGVIICRRALLIARAARCDIPPSQLSRRERAALSMKAHGATDMAIAAELGVCRATASRHIDRAKTKLGAASREAAILKAACLGEIA